MGILTDAQALIPECEAALVTVMQALPGLDLTPFQEKYITMILAFEQMQLNEGWLAEWVTDLAGVNAGLPSE